MKTGRNTSNNDSNSNSNSRLYDCTTSMMMIPKEQSVKFKIGDDNNIVFPETTKRKLEEQELNGKLAKQHQQQHQQHFSTSQIVNGCTTSRCNNTIRPTSDVDDGVMLTTVDSVLGRVFCDNDNTAADDTTTTTRVFSEDYGDGSEEEEDLASRSDTTTTATVSNPWLAMRRNGYGCGSPTTTDSIANTSISTAAIGSSIHERIEIQGRNGLSPQEPLDRQNSLLDDAELGMMTKQIQNGDHHHYDYDNQNEEKKDDSSNMPESQSSQQSLQSQRLWQLRQKKRSIESTYQVTNNHGVVDNDGYRNNNNNKDLDVGDGNNDNAMKSTYFDGLENQNHVYITPDFRIRQEPDIYYKNDDIDGDCDEDEAYFRNDIQQDNQDVYVSGDNDDEDIFTSSPSLDSSSSLSVSTAVKKRLERRMVAMKAVIAISTFLVVAAIIVFILSFIIPE
mmetsp:Transcript_33888/g.81516  ORF Transcript_33888/g.81516 Transcript_33888/m.81516 type:complete len:448 (+) Transcript_33888:125-1468(+)